MRRLRISSRSSSRWAAALPLLALLSAGLYPHAEGSQWARLREHSDEAHGGGHTPAIRYSHGAAVVGNQMVVSHGYFYNRENANPEWLHDTWSLSLDAPAEWTRLAVGVNPFDAYPKYKAGGVPDAPSGRYGVTLTHYQGKLYLFGGTDGGASKHGRTGYEAKYEMDEMWELDLKTNKWTLMTLGRGDYKPQARYLHTAVLVGDSIYVFGGNSDGVADVVAFHVPSKKWSQLVDEETTTKIGPGPRLGHVALPVVTDSFRGFAVYGGRRRSDNFKKLAGDVWLFDVEASAWEGPLDMATPPGVPAPAPRLYAGLTPVELQGVAYAASGGSWAATGVLTLGSTTTPVMSCTNEAWMLLITANASVAVFSRLPDAPVGHYHHSLVARGETVYGFGGHLCSKTKGDHPFYYLNAVDTLEVSAAQVPDVATLVRVDTSEHDEL